MGVLKEFFKDIYCKVKYNTLSIDSKKANSLRCKNDKKKLNRIIRDINREIKKSSCLCSDSTFHFACNKSYSGNKYFLIKYNRNEIALKKEHFNFLLSYYSDKGFDIVYVQRTPCTSSVSNDYRKGNVKIKDDSLFDVKKLEPINPENCNFYIEW